MDRNSSHHKQSPRAKWQQCRGGDPLPSGRTVRFPQVFVMTGYESSAPSPPPLYFPRLTRCLACGRLLPTWWFFSSGIISLRGVRVHAYGFYMLVTVYTLSLFVIYIVILFFVPVSTWEWTTHWLFQYLCPEAHRQHTGPASTLCSAPCFRHSPLSAKDSLPLLWLMLTHTWMNHAFLPVR